LALSFVLPLLQLMIWSIKNAGDIDSRYWGFIARSVMLAGSAVVVIVSASLLLAYLERRRSTASMKALVRLATLGYAVPGTVLAVGIVVPLVLLNNYLQGLLRDWFGADAPVLLLQGTLIAVLVAYLARFLTVGFNPVESGLQRITRSIDEVATAATLVFVDVMKEMPITLITRPPGWDTLAVRVWEMTSEGEWERAALPAVAIVLVGLVPAAMLTRRGAHVA
jgi:iron(III) transport system permease protein